MAKEAVPGFNGAYRSMPPEMFGRYQLLKRLAAGGMGEVFVARQRGPSGFEKLLVLKRILPQLSKEEEFIQMFFDEARIAANLNHPNIAQIFDLGDVDGVYFIAMEYVAGYAARAVVVRAQARKGNPPVGMLCRIFADAAAGLDYAHNARSSSGDLLELIHRDVSPQNILIGLNGSVKLIDFGVAKAANKLSNTAAGTVKGKYAYMSPEQARGEDLDGRSDLFGLATVFWESLTGQRLWKRENDMATLRAVTKDKPALVASMVEDVPKALDQILQKALSKKRTERFRSCADFQLALEELIMEQRLPATNRHLAMMMDELFGEETTASGAGTNTSSRPSKAGPSSTSGAASKTTKSTIRRGEPTR